MNPAAAPSTDRQANREAFERMDAARWGQADLAAALLALMPLRLKGAVFDGAAPELAGLLQDRLTQRLGAGTVLHRMPVSITDDRLIGGLDLAATLAAGSPIAETGLLARADGGVLIVPMAERLPGRAAAQLARVIDTGEVETERDGLSLRTPAKFVTLAFADPDEPGDLLPAGLGDRLAFGLSLHGVSPARPRPETLSPAIVDAARAKLRWVSVPNTIMDALIDAGLRLGIRSLRAPAFCLAAARGIAALAGRDEVTDADASLAAELVYASRANVLIDRSEPPAPPEPPEPDNENTDDVSRPQPEADELTELLVEAVRVRVSLDMAARARTTRQRTRQEVPTGRSGDMVDSRRRGSRIGARAGDPRRDGRLDLLSTLRTAAPWQRIREAPSGGAVISVRASDFRVKRFRHRSEAVVIFVVDASGSSAMNRLADAKGAIELLLSGCYSRRESVALIAFRKEGANLLLPPTRSLTRVKRSLSRLPGGGGTPLAAGIAAAAQLVRIERRKRKAPHVVFLSDGQGNIALDGTPGRDRAAEDARDMARRLKSLQERVLFFDISKRPSAQAELISTEMGAIYRPLPLADAARVSRDVRSLLLE
ncbi:MAG: magnesium chelatase subunit D [Hyphomonas sp.]|nr:magnesium chelatase subunit D [Hyphomonas sp.]